MGLPLKNWIDYHNCNWSTNCFISIVQTIYSTHLPGKNILIRQSCKTQNYVQWHLFLPFSANVLLLILQSGLFWVPDFVLVFCFCFELLELCGGAWVTVLWDVWKSKILRRKCIEVNVALSLWKTLFSCSKPCWADILCKLNYFHHSLDIFLSSFLTVESLSLLICLPACGHVVWLHSDNSN